MWSRVTGFTGVAVLLALQGSWSQVAVPGDPFPGIHLPRFSLDAGVGSKAEETPQEFPHLYRIPVLVTGYSSTPEETDEDPFITASNKWVQRGYIALSRDLLRPYTPGAPFTFGDQVEVVGVGVFQVEDTMNPRYRRRADIWFEDKASALDWGAHRLILGRLVAGPAPAFDPALAPRADALPFQPATPDRRAALAGPGV